MKKAYAKPTATKVDFEYKDQVIARSGEIGTHGRPAHTQYCQFKELTCNMLFNSDLGCDQHITSLNL